METEVKLKVDAATWAQLRARPEAWGPSEVQTDTFYAHPTRDLVAAGEALRLRRVLALSSSGAHAPERYELTHKGPRMAGSGKARVETNVACATDPSALLAALGFAPRLVIRKARRSATADGVNVHLDDVERLGTYVELEVLGNDVATSRRLIAAVQAKIGLASATEEPRSYAEMVAALT